MERVQRACAATSRETLLKTVDSFERRLRLCLQANGENFVQLPVADCNTGKNGERQGDSR